MARMFRGPPAWRRMLRKAVLSSLPRPIRAGEGETIVRGRFSRRALLVGAGQAGVLGLLGSHLYDLQVTTSRRYRLLAEENRIHTQAIAPVRGSIADRRGRVLAGSRESLQVVMIPELAGEPEQLVQRLARIIALREEERQRILSPPAGQSRLVPVLIRDDLSWEEFARVNVLAPQLPGIEAQVGWRRTYNEGPTACHVVGYVGRADALELDRDPVLRLPGQRVGKSGVELGLEGQLKGVPGFVRREVDARGRVVREIEREPSVPGRNLTLTLDTELQAAVLRRMRQEDWSSVVAMDVASGDLVALASTPGFDPSLFTEGISSANWQKLREADGDPLLDKAVRGQYPPGSTYKIVTALAGLEAGAITTETSFTCTGGLDYAGQHFGCWKSGGHGRVRLHEALRESCDVFFYETGRLVGVERLARTARELGLGKAHGFGIAGERSGIVPDPDWKLSTRSRPWLGGETLLASIGQGYVLTTPLQLAVMTARLASGRLVSPRLVLAADGRQSEAAPMSFAGEHLEAVRSGLVAVVNEPGGTGASAALDGVLLAGKTGTAQVTRLSRGVSSGDMVRNLRDHSLFVCYAPAAQPRYAVAAIVEHGGGGSKAAAPLARDVMATLLRLDPAGRPAGGAGAAPAGSPS